MIKSGFFSKIKIILSETSLRISWALIALVALLLLFFYLFFFKPTLENINNQVVLSRVETIKHAKNGTESYLNDIVKTLERLDFSLSQAESIEEKKGVISSVFKGKSWISQISLINDQGDETLRVSQLSLFDQSEYYNYSENELFLEPRDGKVFISDLRYSEKDFPYFVVSQQMKREGGGFGGVIVAQISLHSLWDSLGSIGVGQGANIILVDGNGIYMADNDKLKVYRKKNISSRAIFQKVVKQKEMAIGARNELSYKSDNGEPLFVIGAPLTTADWGVFIEEPESLVWANYDKINFSGLVLGALTTWLFFILIANSLLLANVFIDLRSGRELLSKEISRRTNELQELDRVAKLLVKRDLELTAANNELDDKILELEESKKSLLTALSDVQDARKKSEEEKEKTMAIISNFTDPVIVLDKNDIIQLINPAAVAMLDIKAVAPGMKIKSANDFGMDNFRTIIGKEFSLKTIKPPEKERGPSFEEITIPNKEQDIVFKVITAKISSPDGKYLGVMKIFNDLTREKMIDKMKSEFISIAAHQLRTPLSAIKWIIKMVLDGDAGELNKEQHDLLQKGYQSNERIIGLVNDLLNVSRIEEGRFGYNFDYGDFNEVITVIVESCEKLIAKNHQKFEVIKPTVLPKVYMDKERISLVLQNLVENAIKYTPEYGSIELKVTVDEGHLKISVRDNGVGIPKEDTAKIFTKFFRASNVIRMETEGTGLGLFIAKNIVEKHGGIIEMESEEGKGTMFTFTVLMEKAEDGKVPG